MIIRESWIFVIIQTRESGNIFPFPSLGLFDAYWWLLRLFDAK